MKKIILSITLIYCFALNSNAQTAGIPYNGALNAASGVTLAVTASAEIVEPLTLAMTAMYFGKIAAGNATKTGAVVLSAETGTATVTTAADNGINLLASTTDAIRSGIVTVSGDNSESSETFGFYMPTTVTLGITAGDKTSSDNLTSNMVVTLSNTATANGTGNSLIGGELIIYIGGSLQIDADQDAGVYSGSFNVFCIYE